MEVVLDFVIEFDLCSLIGSIDRVTTCLLTRLKLVSILACVLLIRILLRLFGLL